MLVLRLSRFSFQALSREGFVFTVCHSEVNTLPSVHSMCVHSAHFWSIADSLLGILQEKLCYIHDIYHCFEFSHCALSNLYIHLLNGS